MLDKWWQYPELRIKYVFPRMQKFVDVLGDKEERNLFYLIHHIEDIFGDSRNPWDIIQDFIKDEYDCDGNEFQDDLYNNIEGMKKKLDEYLGVKESRIHRRIYRI